MALQPMIFDGHVLAFEVVRFTEAFAERGRNVHGGIGRPSVDKRDHWHRRLLRAHRTRASCGDAADQGDEFAPPHSITSSALVGWAKSPAPFDSAAASRVTDFAHA